MSVSTYAKKEFSLKPADLLVDETIFHNANGYLGVRSNFEEGYPDGVQSIRGTYLNGFYDISYMGQAEKLYGLVEEKQTMLNVCDTQGIRIFVGDEEFSMFRGEVLSRERLLNMEDGITARKVTWRSPKGKEISISFTRMASFTILPLFLIQVQVTPLNFGGEIRIESAHIGDVKNFSDPSDPRVSGEDVQYLTVVETIYENSVSVIVSKTSKSDLTFCSCVKNLASGEIDRQAEKRAGQVKETLRVEARAGETVWLDKYSVLCDSIRFPDPKIAAQNDLAQALLMGAPELFARQREYLMKLGLRDAVEITGDEELNTSVNYNVFQLIQSVSRDPHASIAAKGLSGEGYEGHYFWDTEMYLQPFFTLTQPALARNLIRYRYSILEYARENARLLGHKKGAAYPWRTIMGKECSGHYPSGSAQYHISGDVAYAVIAYYLATGDLDLIEECGAEIVFETARMWLELGNFYKGKFYINEVTGPDEYTCLVNNNYYTNVVARHNLRWAVKFLEILKEKGRDQALVHKLGITPAELSGFREAAEKMYLPYDEELGINPQDDSFLQKKPWDLSTITEEEKPLLMHYHPMFLYRHRITKQADTVMAHFILEDEQSEQTLRNSFAFYETVTTHDSSLSTCIFSIVASKLGLSEKAYAYFGDSAKLDLFNTHKNTKDGIHTANMGGTYMAIVYGFGGLRIKESGLSLNPALPARWTSYRFCFCYLDSQIEVRVERDAATITLLAGTGKRISVWGQPYQLSGILSIPGPARKYRGIIFDLDGVICFTDRYHYQAWKAIADKLGIYFDEVINNRLRGVSRMQSLEIILEKYDRPLSQGEKEALASEKNEIYRRLLLNMTPADLSAEVKTTLDQLRARGYKIAIGSSSKNTRTILERIGLGDWFDAISDGNNITRSKPDPEVFLKAAEYLGLPPRECIVVEDADAGIDGAIAAGMDSAAIGDATRSHKATYNLTTFKDLLLYCKE